MGFGKPLSQEFELRIALNRVKDVLEGLFIALLPVHEKSEKSNPAQSHSLQILVRMGEPYLI